MKWGRVLHELKETAWPWWGDTRCGTAKAELHALLSVHLHEKGHREACTNMLDPWPFIIILGEKHPVSGSTHISFNKIGLWNNEIKQEWLLNKGIGIRKMIRTLTFLKNIPLNCGVRAWWWGITAGLTSPKYDLLQHIVLTYKNCSLQSFSKSKTILMQKSSSTHAGLEASGVQQEATGGVGVGVGLGWAPTAVRLTPCRCGRQGWTLRLWPERFILFPRRRENKIFRQLNFSIKWFSTEYLLP